MALFTAQLLFDLAQTCLVHTSSRARCHFLQGGQLFIQIVKIILSFVIRYIAFHSKQMQKKKSVSTSGLLDLTMFMSHYFIWLYVPVTFTVVSSCAVQCEYSG